MTNPYANAGTFVGRHWERERLRRFVSRGESCLVIGGRRAGKTMLLDHMEESELGRRIYRTDVGKWRLHDEASAIGQLGEALGVSTTDRDALEAALRARAPLCLVVDEADRMLREPWSGSLLAWMRWLIGSQGLYTELSIVMAGGPMLLGYEHPDEVGSPVLNISKRRHAAGRAPPRRIARRPSRPARRPPDAAGHGCDLSPPPAPAGWPATRPASPRGRSPRSD